MSIFVEDYGVTKDGEQVRQYIMENAGGMKAVLLNYGAVLAKLYVPDKDGKLRDVVWGYENLAGYEKNGPCLGATVGRNANRIGGASVTIAGKVYEVRSLPVLGDIEFDTYWFPIESVDGIRSVKAIAKEGWDGALSGATSNPDNIYVNGSGVVFETENVGFTNPSRRYDIEMKTVYYYVYDAAQKEFEKIKCEIPMMFVQEDHFDTFSEDVAGANEGLSLTITVLSEDIGALDGYYKTLLPAYNEIAALVSPEDVITFIGEKNSYFDGTDVA